MHRKEYPRPQFKRLEWLNLNGSWDFDFDDNEVSLKEHWELNSHKLSQKIEVPFCFESRLSGIGDTSIHNHCFYKRTFSIPDSWQEKDIILHFGAVDYQCKVFINEKMCGEHKGGHVGFSFLITDFLDNTKEEQTISVYVSDPATDESISRGKQFWKEESEGIWYTRTSGIWQTVWLEPVSPIRIEHIKLTPDVDRGELHLEAEFSRIENNTKLEVTIYFQDELICEDTYSLNSSSVFKRSIQIIGDKIFNTLAHNGDRYWSPENPALYDIKLALKSGDTIHDDVESYFGMRKIHIENGMTYLNNRPYYFKLVLDQGYWSDGIMTAPDDDAFVTDISLMKEMGFNGCRKHQKVEDPRFLYWADNMGFLVWGEMAASCIYTEKYTIDYMKEWYEILRRDYNHPSIIAWVPFNESWAVPNIKSNLFQQHHTLSLYHFIKSIDGTRLVVNNDGWELTKSDICAIHNYAHGNEDELEKREFFRRFTKELDILLSPYPAGKNIYADGFSYQGEPILITECGGIQYRVDDRDGWGYSTAKSGDEFIAQYRFVIESLLESPLIYGFCYTQLSDVEQETNGLLTYDRKPKCDPSVIREINNRYHHPVVLKK